MKAGLLGPAALLLQGSTLLNLGAPSRPETFRYQRPIQIASQGSGVACALLDAAVLAHTASAAHGDLRVFRSLPGENEAEVPYTLTESGPEPVASTAATVDHEVVTGNQVSFDLHMPPRPYSEVRLRMDLHNFVATATVEGLGRQGKPAPLGSVALFDLTDEDLGRWTAMLLGEANWPVLHVTLAVRTPRGEPLLPLPAGVVTGAEVPPSRARQTRFVPVVSTGTLEQHGSLTVALLRVPAHVPVERVAFRFAPGYTANFAREVTVSARADGAPITDTEALDAGEILHLALPSGDPRLYPIDLQENALDATLGATLARPATVLVAVANGNQGVLPIRSVEVEMRERKLCFFADREGTYTLRYGDPALVGPTYDESALTIPAQPLEAQLGLERINPQYRARSEPRGLWKHRPELFWLLVLLCGGMMGGSALHHVQHRRV